MSKIAIFLLANLAKIAGVAVALALAVNANAANDYTKIAVNVGHSCGISPARGLECWGDNTEGESEVPPSAVKSTMVATGTWFTCGADDRRIQCWGEDSFHIKDIPPITNITHLVAGQSHACAVNKQSQVACWGDALYGQLKVPGGLRGITKITTSVTSTCVLGTDGLTCWGREILAEDKPKDLKNITNVAVGDDAICVVASTDVATNEIKCWGQSAYWADHPPQNIKNPRELIAGSRNFTVLHDGGVYCWGDNSDGQCDVPTDLKNPRGLTSGSYRTCAITDTGIRCWGH